MIQRSSGEPFNHSISKCSGESPITNDSTTYAADQSIISSTNAVKSKLTQAIRNEEYLRNLRNLWETRVYLWNEKPKRVGYGTLQQRQSTRNVTENDTYDIYDTYDVYEI